MSVRSELPVYTDLLSMVLADTPLMDVRAPVEFQRGGLPTACNLPLLDDAQRQKIGLEYKQSGQDAAIELGQKLATPAVREARLQAWNTYLDAHPHALLYCWRGGLRSRITQQWLAESGRHVPRVQGGFKAIRSFLLQSLADFCAQVPLWVITGMTGCGKTDLLCSYQRVLDLEGLARHRGSAFGATGAYQPTQIDFENSLAIRMLKLAQNASGPVLVEDESRLIGRILVPLPLQAALKNAPVLELQASLEERVARILEDYVIAPSTRLSADALEAFVLGNLARIRKRLGGERHARLAADWQLALQQLHSTGDATGFAAGIAELLEHYYDPMYHYQQSRSVRPVLLRGTAQELHPFLHQRLSP